MFLGLTFYNYANTTKSFSEKSGIFYSFVDCSIHYIKKTTAITIILEYFEYPPIHKYLHTLARRNIQATGSQDESSKVQSRVSVTSQKAQMFFDIKKVGMCHHTDAVFIYLVFAQHVLRWDKSTVEHLSLESKQTNRAPDQLCAIIDRNLVSKRWRRRPVHQ